MSTKNLAMLKDYRYWRNVNQLNNMIIKNKSNIKYILIIPSTINFQLLNDLNTTFKRKIDMVEYFQQFKKLGCYILYLTLFTLKQKNTLGPIANDISTKIVIIYLKKFLKSLNSNVQIVGPNWLKHKLNIMSYDAFLDIMI